MILRGLGIAISVLLTCWGGSAANVALAQAMPEAAAGSRHGIAVGLYRPEYPDDLTTLTAYDQAIGAPVALVHWYVLWGGWKAAFNQADLEAVQQHGAVPMITWEPWAGIPRDPTWTLRERILSGASDDYIRSWARGLAAYGGPVLLRFAHEMHDQSYPWAVGVNGNTAEDYLAAWRHVRAIFDEEGASNVSWGWNPNTMPGTTTAAYEAIYTSLYPGNDLVDWVGLDIYNGGSSLEGWGGWRSFSDALANPYAALRAVTSKPLILAEVGSAETGGAKADWIRSAVSDLESGRFPGVRALVWFDIDKEEQWAVHSSSAAFEAWRVAVRGADAQSGLPF
jgi:beta-mannanase